MSASIGLPSAIAYAMPEDVRSLPPLTLSYIENARAKASLYLTEPSLKVRVGPPSGGETKEWADQYGIECFGALDGIGSVAERSPNGRGIYYASKDRNDALYCVIPVHKEGVYQIRIGTAEQTYARCTTAPDRVREMKIVAGQLTDRGQLNVSSVQEQFIPYVMAGGQIDTIGYSDWLRVEVEKSELRPTIMIALFPGENIENPPTNTTKQEPAFHTLEVIKQPL